MSNHPVGPTPILTKMQALANKQVSRSAAFRATRPSVVVRAQAQRKLWAPTVVAPDYLNGTLAGDYGRWLHLRQHLSAQLQH